MSIEYTQHTVAFPKLKVDPNYDWHYDEVLVNLSDDDTTAPRGADIRWIFMHFGLGHGGGDGVQLSVFGDGLHTLAHPVVAHVIASWRLMEKPDDLTPAGLIRLLQTAGAVPSSYHAQGLAAARKAAMA